MCDRVSAVIAVPGSGEPSITSSFYSLHHKFVLIPAWHDTLLLVSAAAIQHLSRTHAQLAAEQAGLSIPAFRPFPSCLSRRLDSAAYLQVHCSSMVGIN